MLLALLALRADAIDFPADQAAVPPMGWNSWNCYGRDVTAERVLAQATALAESGLREKGFVYVVIDDGWQGERAGAASALQGNDAFPEIDALSRDVRALGLRLGIYSTPWETSYQGLEGSADHEAADAWQWARWDVRYLKYDWNPVDVAAATRMRDALASTGAPIVYSLSNHVSRAQAPTWARLSNLWRTSSDIVDEWESVERIGFDQAGWETYAGPGHWNDPDMMVLGYVGWGEEQHATRLTADEQRTHVTLWALLAAPLILGADLERLDEPTLALLTNDRVLEVDQDPAGIQAARVSAGNDQEVWARPLASGAHAVGVFNRGEEEAEITVDFQSIGIAGKQEVTDLWEDESLGLFEGSVSVDVPAHGARLLRVGTAAPVAPAFVGPLRETARLGEPFGYTVLTSGTRPVTLTADGLPPGLALDGSLVSGTPTTAGGWEVTLVAENDGGTAWGVLEITVTDHDEGDVEVLLFAPDEMELPPGQEGRLAWVVENADSVRIDPDPGAVRETGEATIRPETTTTYTLFAEGPGGPVEAAFTVEVPTEAVALSLDVPGRLRPTNDASEWQGWGEAADDTSLDGGALSVGGTSASHGIGTHAGSRIAYDLDGRYAWFSARAGVDDETDAPRASVVFAVELDGELAWESPTVGAADGPISAGLDVRGVRELVLVAADAGDGIDDDHADWLDPEVIPMDAAETSDGGETAQTEEKRCGCASFPGALPAAWAPIALSLRRRKPSYHFPQKGPLPTR